MNDEQHEEVQAQEQDSPETVALAREMGWKPESEWKGNPPKGGFTSATEFVQRGEKILPIMNARAKKAEARVQELQDEIASMRSEHRDNLRRIERMSKVTLEQQRLQIAAQYGAKKEAAVEVGDKEAYRQADKDEREAIKAIDERLTDDDGKDDKGKKSAEMPKEIKSVIDEWIGENPWFNADEELNALAQARHMKLLKEKPGMTLRQNLDAVREYVANKFPEKFGIDDDGDDDDNTPPRRRGSPVEGGSRVNGGGGGSLWSKVPATDRDVALKAGHLEYFLKAGETMEKDKAKAQQRWAEKYFEGDAA